MRKKRMIYYVILKTASYTEISNLYVHVYINRRSSYCQADEAPGIVVIWVYCSDIIVGLRTVNKILSLLRFVSVLYTLSAYLSSFGQR